MLAVGAFFVVLPVFAQPVLSINGLNANYTTTHVFVDEVAGDTVPLTILFTPNAANLTQVEFFSNVNRRDRAATDADSDGVEEVFVNRAAISSLRETTRITSRLTR